MVNMTPIVSSNISEVGYDDEQKELFVKFNSGKTYQYYDVLAEVFDDFLQADSHGKYFNANIRNAYAYAQVY